MRTFLVTSTLLLAACAQQSDGARNETSLPGEMAEDRGEMPAAIATPKTKTAPPAPSPSDPLERSIPTSMHGNWRESADDRVTAADCNLQNYENATRTLTIRADNFTQFETGGRLLNVTERSNVRIRATFDTTYADEPTQGDYVFELRDGGETLIVEEVAEGGRGPVRHRRCPE